MARLPRIVIPGLPHHVTQRGNGRAQVFFEDGDYQLYLDLLSAAARRAHCAVWAYCLMPNHIHAMVVPSDEDGLRRTFADARITVTVYLTPKLGHIHSHHGTSPPHCYSRPSASCDAAGQWAGAGVF